MLYKDYSNQDKSALETGRPSEMDASECQYTFTVFTPTYNRAYTLHRVYESLKAQTFRDFEWLVVDDGSTDGTRELIDGWRASASFPVRYYFQENSGKHVAHNRACSLARGRFTVVADSDDSFVPVALERFLFSWNTIPAPEQRHFCGITCLVQDQNGQLMGRRFPLEPMDSNLFEIFYRYQLQDEQWSVYRTDILRKFPFPEAPGEKYALEGLVWFKIAKEYKTRCVNDVLRTYFRGGADQISRSDNFPRTDTLVSLYFGHILNDHTPWFLYAPRRFCRAAVAYAHFSFLIGSSWVEQWRKLTNPLGKLLWLGGVVPGYLLAKRDARRRARETASA